MLLDSLKLYNNNLELLTELSRAYIATEDWPRVEDIETSLREIGSDEALSLADRIRVSILRAQKRDQDAISFLETLSQENGGCVPPRLPSFVRILRITMVRPR